MWSDSTDRRRWSTWPGGSSLSATGSRVTSRNGWCSRGSRSMWSWRTRLFSGSPITPRRSTAPQAGSSGRRACHPDARQLRRALPHRLMRYSGPDHAGARRFAHEPGSTMTARTARRADRHLGNGGPAVLTPTRSWSGIGTGLRPFLEAIPAAVERDAFLAEYTLRIRAAYRPQPDGHVRFPFADCLWWPIVDT